MGAFFQTMILSTYSFLNFNSINNTDDNNTKISDVAMGSDLQYNMPFDTRKIMSISEKKPAANDSNNLAYKFYSKKVGKNRDQKNKNIIYNRKHLIQDNLMGATIASGVNDPRLQFKKLKTDENKQQFNKKSKTLRNNNKNASEQKSLLKSICNGKKTKGKLNICECATLCDVNKPNCFYKLEKKTETKTTNEFRNSNNNKKQHNDDVESNHNPDDKIVVINMKTKKIEKNISDKLENFIEYNDSEKTIPRVTVSNPINDKQIEKMEVFRNKNNKNQRKYKKGKESNDNKKAKRQSKNQNESNFIFKIFNNKELSVEKTPMVFLKETEQLYTTKNESLIIAKHKSNKNFVLDKKITDLEKYINNRFSKNQTAHNVEKKRISNTLQHNNDCKLRSVDTEHLMETKMKDVYAYNHKNDKLQKISYSRILYNSKLKNKIQELIAICFHEFNSCCFNSILIIKNDKLLVLANDKLHILRLKMEQSVTKYKNNNESFSLECRRPGFGFITEQYQKCCRIERERLFAVYLYKKVFNLDKLNKDTDICYKDSEYIKKNYVFFLKLY
ncbi:hypothetical protein COBT_001712 [Conglomerata obtusa]